MGGHDDDDDDNDDDDDDSDDDDDDNDDCFSSIHLGCHLMYAGAAVDCHSSFEISGAWVVSCHLAYSATKSSLGEVDEVVLRYDGWLGEAGRT